MSDGQWGSRTAGESEEQLFPLFVCPTSRLPVREPFSYSAMRQSPIAGIASLREAVAP